MSELLTLARELKQGIQDNASLPLTKKRLLRHYVMDFEEKRDLTILRLFSRMGDDHEMIPKARYLATTLRTYGPSEVIRDVEKHHVEAFFLIHDAVKGAALQNTNTVAHSNDDPFALEVFLMFFNDTAKVPSISKLILERGLTNTKSLVAIMEETESKHSTLREGSL